MGSDGKRTVGCGGKADGDGNDNDNGGVYYNCGVDINDGNEANGSDDMSQTNCDDGLDGGSGNNNDDGSVDGNDAFDVKGGDKADNGDEQTQSATSDLVKCNGSYKMEMRVGVMR